MTTPTLDIILPVWNNPAETRSCLVSLLPCIEAGARLLLINNGCNRETELLLEEFSDPLGSQAVYMTMERNVGFVPAVNHGLRRSDADWALVLRPSVVLHGTTSREWLARGAARDHAGILTPCFASLHPAHRQMEQTPFTVIETSAISFDLLALSRTMRNVIGEFAENLDSGDWCLEDYRQRARSAGFLTCLASGFSFSAGPITLFGSEERRRSHEEQSRLYCQQQWGIRRRAAVYLPGTVDAALVADTCSDALAAARLGHQVHLFLHRRQYREAVQAGFHLLHTDVRLYKLPFISPQRTLVRHLGSLVATHPDLLILKGIDGLAVPGYDGALPATVLRDLGSHGTEG